MRSIAKPPRPSSPMRPRLRLAIAAATIVLAATATAVHAQPFCSTSPCTAPTRVPGIGARDTAPGDSSVASDELITEGRKIFHGRGTCFTCHGASLEGSAIAPTLREHPWKDAKGGSVDAIYQIVTHGVSGTVMVSHPGGISDADARRVAAYIWAVSHGHARP